MSEGSAPKPVAHVELQAVPASLPQTCSVERLAEFFDRAAARRQGLPRLGYPAAYYRWLAAMPGRDSYMDAALIDEQRHIVGAAISRPLNLGMWSNMKLRAALREAAADGKPDRSTKGWVRYLTRERDADLLAALATLLPEEHYALRTAVIEFLDVDPERADLSSEGVLLEVILNEARAAGYDYLLCWSRGAPPPLPPNRAARAVAAEAVLELLVAGDAGLLRVYNSARYTARAIKLWVRERLAAAREAIRRLRRWRRRLPAIVRSRRKKGTESWESGTEEEGLGPEGEEKPPGPGGEPQAPDPRPSVPKAQALTFDGIRILRVAGPNLSLSDELVERLRTLMADTNDSYGIFPSYDGAQLKRLLAPARGDSRFSSAYAVHREGGPSVLTVGSVHDVLSYVAAKDDRPLAFVFGHRLPWLMRDDWVDETWLIRAVYFARELGTLTRADVLQRCVDAATFEYGLGRALLLRHAGLGERLFSRVVLGSRRVSAGLQLHYVPLSESALAEEAVLARRLPVGYV